VVAGEWTLDLDWFVAAAKEMVCVLAAVDSPVVRVCRVVRVCVCVCVAASLY
jgi:hypothetical protein